MRTTHPCDVTLKVATRAVLIAGVYVTSDNLESASVHSLYFTLKDARAAPVVTYALELAYSWRRLSRVGYSGWRG